MSPLSHLGTSLSLLTDLYQITMAHGYWASGLHKRETIFHLFFRKNPFEGAYSLFCGLDQVVDFLQRFRFEKTDLAYLAELCGSDGGPLFPAEFLSYLKDLRLTCHIDAVAEGTPVFPHEPLIRVQGPIIQCQLLETALLNMINFQTLIATKTARIVNAAQGDPVLEFGLRRAQGIDGSLSAARAAYIGGCVATSNVLAGKLYSIPVKGTHAHSWVMAFEDELESFEAYAATMPNNCVFLVDTYNTLDGVDKAIKVGLQLRKRGHEILGVRLDSGDLVSLSIEARRRLDAAGFPKAAVVASNDLDEYEVTRLKQQGAKIDTWGIGTRLVTAYDQPALGGVYKLAAVREPGKPWEYRIKKSEDAIKTSNPGQQQIRRFYAGRKPVGDVIYDQLKGYQQTDHYLTLHGEKVDLFEHDHQEDLLQPIFRNGQLVAPRPQLAQIRERALGLIHDLGEQHLNLNNPTSYPQGLAPELMAARQALL